MPRGSGASVPGELSFRTRGVWRFRTRGRGGTDISIPLSQFPSHSQTLSVYHRYSQILSYLQTCHFRVGNWETGLHPWSRELADPSFLTCSFILDSALTRYIGTPPPTLRPWSPGAQPAVGAGDAAIHHVNSPMSIRVRGTRRTLPAMRRGRAPPAA